MTRTDETADESLLQKKWGPALNGGFVVAPAALFRFQHELDISDGEVVVLMNLLMSWWNPDELPFPRASTLAKRMGVSQRTVLRHLDRLEEKDLVRRVRDERSDDYRRGLTRYDLSGIVARLKDLGEVFHPSRQREHLS